MNMMCYNMNKLWRGGEIMNKEEYERKVTELKSMKIALFTDEIRNSNLYYKINMDSDLPAKLENLKIDLQNKAKIYKHLSLAADMAIPLPKEYLLLVCQDVVKV